jgi:hypothetical protein
MHPVPPLPTSGEFAAARDLRCQGQLKCTWGPRVRTGPLVVGYYSTGLVVRSAWQNFAPGAPELGISSPKTVNPLSSVASSLHCPPAAVSSSIVFESPSALQIMALMRARSIVAPIWHAPAVAPPRVSAAPSRSSVGGKKNGGALDGICAARIRLGYRFVSVNLWRRDRIQRTRCVCALLNGDCRSCGEWPGSNLVYPFKSLDRNRGFQI